MCHKRAFFPFILILLGVVFLLRNYGALPEGLEIGKLWPLILIAVGLGALFCRRGRCAPSDSASKS